MGKVAVVMGSISDWAVAEQAVHTLRHYGVTPVARVLSAHRTPEETRAFTRTLEEEGIKVVIALAGMAAHLAGAIAAGTVVPVIGVPVASGPMAGQDALYSTVQMPSGIPVATVAIGGAKNAALLAVQMLAIHDDSLKQRLLEGREQMRLAALAADRQLTEKLMKEQG